MRTRSPHHFRYRPKRKFERNDLPRDSEKEIEQGQREDQAVSQVETTRGETAGKRQRISLGGPPEILDPEKRGQRQRPKEKDEETLPRVERVASEGRTVSEDAPQEEIIVCATQSELIEVAVPT